MKQLVGGHDTPLKSSPRWESSQGLTSARVVQLKKEIDDLDARLAKTNSINFDDIRSSYQTQQNEVGRYGTTSHHQA